MRFDPNDYNYPNSAYYEALDKLTASQAREKTLHQALDTLHQFQNADGRKSLYHGSLLEKEVKIALNTKEPS